MRCTRPWLEIWGVVQKCENIRQNLATGLGQLWVAVGGPERHRRPRLQRLVDEAVAQDRRGVCKRDIYKILLLGFIVLVFRTIEKTEWERDVAEAGNE